MSTDPTLRTATEVTDPDGETYVITCTVGALHADAYPAAAGYQLREVRGYETDGDFVIVGQHGTEADEPQEVNAAQLRTLLRDLRTAGWRHTIDYRTEGRDADGAPWRDDVRVHIWSRHGGETIEFDHHGYWISHDSGHADGYEFCSIDVGIGWIERHGLNALHALAGKLGVTAAGTYPDPTARAQKPF